MVLGDGNLLYLLSDRLRAHDRRTGREVWNIDPQTYFDSLTATPFGEVLVTSAGAMFLLRSDGTLDRLPIWFGRHTKVAPSGERYVGVGSILTCRVGNVEKWRMTVRKVAGFDLLPNGDMLVAGADLVAFNRRRQWLWRFAVGQVHAGPVLAGDLAYVATEESVSAIDVRGRSRWHYPRRVHRTDPVILLKTSDGAPVFVARQKLAEGTSLDLMLGPPPGVSGDAR
jgi:outer membrane protein assembly factor BamB